MTTLRQVKAAALKIGAKVEDDKIGNAHECRVEAPRGFIWSEGDVHELVDAAYKPWKPDYDGLLSRMSYGIETCPHGPDCEWCNHETESE